MKFQKTLLAASLAIAAASTVNAAVDSSYLKNANPTQQSETLYQNSNVNLNTTINQFVVRPVLGQSVTSSYDLGSQVLPGGVIAEGSEKVYEIFNYQTESGKNVVSLSLLGPNGQKTPQGYFEITGPDGQKYLKPYEANDVILSTLSDGGQLTQKTGEQLGSGYELKAINNEHLVYGYQGSTFSGSESLIGSYIDPNGVSKPFEGTLGGNPQATSKYVNTGIIGNTGAYNVDGSPVDVSKNIYGVSAKDGKNFVGLTGNGIALADLSKGTLQYDGSVLTGEKLVGTSTDSVQKTRQYNNVDGRTIVEIYNDDEGNVSPSKYFVAQLDSTGNYTLSETKDVNATTLAGLTPARSGAGTYKNGTYEISKIHNTVTNQNVKYSETISTVDKTIAQAGITTSENSSVVAKGDLTSSNSKVVSSQYTSNGVIGTRVCPHLALHQINEQAKNNIDL